MTKYTTRHINIASLLITIIIFFITQQYKTPTIPMNTQKIEKLFKKDLILVELKSNNINQDTKENEKDTQNFGLTEEEKNRNERIEKAQWKITIPKISLKAEISEGTSKEIMDKFVGHFEETTKTSGNVGLAAHNRGYAVNYFANIKQLVEGDKIIYKYYEFEETYIVTENKIIEDIDWEPLENTKENKITLIALFKIALNKLSSVNSSYLQFILFLLMVFSFILLDIRIFPFIILKASSLETYSLYNPFCNSFKSFFENTFAKISSNEFFRILLFNNSFISTDNLLHLESINIRISLSLIMSLLKDILGNISIIKLFTFIIPT